jgi:heterodisulfide reductase subunit B
MKVGYYPGCSLKGTARDYAESIEGCCRLLGIELCELEDWNCCGATAAHSLNDEAATGLAARNITIAEGVGLDMLVPCPLCFNRLKTAGYRLTEKGSASTGEKVNIWDLANFIAREDLISSLTRSVQKELGGLKAVCYYGCMASRPPKITGEPNYENPQSMDRILRAIGVDVRDWSFKTDCCGASHLVARPDIVFTLVGRLYSEARKAGAECIVVSCQMCQANLDLHQKEILGEGSEPLPILYFTELIGISLGYAPAVRWLKGHFVDPLPLLEEKGLLPEGCDAGKKKVEKR